MAAGTRKPPIAAITGRAALRGLASAPSQASRLISSPTSRKKIAINPSLIQCSSGLARPIDPIRTSPVRCRNAV
jgi:hypothetical protein